MSIAFTEILRQLFASIYIRYSLPPTRYRQVDDHLSRFLFSTVMLKTTRNTTGVNVRTRAPATSLVRIRDPSRLLCRSTYSFTKFRASMKPSMTVRMKMSVDKAQKASVCSGLEGPKSPKWNDVCHTSSATIMASSTVPEM